MHQYPHHYVVNATAGSSGTVSLDSEGLPTLPAAPPRQYDGPGDQWSPETLLMAAVAGCFVLSFRAIARASGLLWDSLECEAAGVLDRVDRVVKFTAIEIKATLTLPAGGDERRAPRLLEKAEESCLITNSLNVKPTLAVTIRTASA